MNGVERSNDGVIQQAIESAKCRIYKLNFDLNGKLSAHHQKKAENQKELMEITVKALERYNALERVIERLEEESNFFKGEPMGSLQKAYYCMGIEKAIEIIKKEVGDARIN